MSSGARGMELVRILEASSASLRQGGSRIPFIPPDGPRPAQAATHSPGAEGHGAPKVEKKNLPETARHRATQPAVTA